MPVESFVALLESLSYTAASLQMLVYIINDIVSALELISARLVFFGLFLYGLYRFVRRGG